MPTALIVFLTIYAIVAASLMILGVSLILASRVEPRVSSDEGAGRLGARLVLGAIAWPVLAAYYLIPAVTYLWDTADFDRKGHPMSKTVYRYNIPLDDQPHEYPDGPVTLVTANRAGDIHSVEAWIHLDTINPLATTQRLQVYGTGHTLPQGAVAVGSCLAGPFVWHVMRLQSDGEPL